MAVAPVIRSCKPVAASTGQRASRRGSNKLRLSASGNPDPMDTSTNKDATPNPGPQKFDSKDANLDPSEKGTNQFCGGLPGSTPPFVQFDPFGFSTFPLGAVRRFREAEVTHGRVAMLAAVGFLANENIQVFFRNYITEDTAAFQFQQVPSPFWELLTLLIGVAETYRARLGWKAPDESVWTLREDYRPGDLGFDPLGIKPSRTEDLRNMQARELNNGRLAMVSVIGFMVQELKFHKPILAQ